MEVGMKMKNRFSLILILIAILLLGLVQVVSYYNLNHWQNTITTIVWIYLIIVFLHTIYYAFKCLSEYLKRKQSQRLK